MNADRFHFPSLWMLWINRPATSTRLAGTGHRNNYVRPKLTWVEVGIIHKTNHIVACSGVNVRRRSSTGSEHAALDAAVANCPNERFKLRNGIRVICQHVPLDLSHDK